VDPRDEVRRGFVWLGAASAVARVLEVFKVLVVLYCLSQEQLGEATLAWSVSVVLEALSGLGVGRALVQGGDEVHEGVLSSAFWYALSVATLLVLGVCAAAHPLALAYGRPSLGPMIMLASTKLWFVGAAIVPLALLNRRLAYERMAVISTLSTLSSGVTTCALALSGVGAWAPLLGHIMGGFATMVFAYIAEPYRPRLRFDWPSLRPHASFGTKVSGASLLHQIYRNVDYLLVGQWLDVATVGVYRVAFDLAMTPCLAIGQVVHRAASPVYARLRDDPAALSRTFLWTLSSLGLSLVPATVLLSLNATSLLSVVKGGGWLDAAPVVPWLCGAALLRCLDQAFPLLFQAMHRPWLALWDSVLAAALVSALIAVMLELFGVKHGSVAAAWGWALAYPLLIAILIGMTRRMLPLTLAQVFFGQRHTLGAALAMSLAHVAVSCLLRERAGGWVLVLPALASLGAYTLYVRYVARVRVFGPAAPI
jgi:O-antigen/teichoic acid export membrane protein